MLQQSTLIKFIINYRYLALFPIACIEGPIVALGVGFLIHLGYLSIIPSFFIMILGDFVPDSIYYFIGHYNNKEKLLKKYDTKTKLISKNFNHIENAWHKHTWKTMFFSKLAYGLSTPFLILGGLVHIPYKKFILRSLTVSMLNYGILIFLGYYLGQSYKNAIPYIKYIGIIIAIIALVIVVLYIFIQKYIKNKIIKIIEEEK